MTREGGVCVVSILYISAEFEKNFKDPALLTAKNVSERLNNLSCVLTGSCGHRRRKFDNAVYFSAIDSHPPPWSFYRILNANYRI